MSGVMRDFVDFLLEKSFLYKRSTRCDPRLIDAALEATLADARWRYPRLTAEAVIRNIQANGGYLPVFLHRLGRPIFLKDASDPLVEVVHGVMRECCSCEIYFSTEIGVGFEVVHGVGTVIGSRNRIGEGFRIFQGCTVGHKKDGGEPGAVIGARVTLWAHSSILGAITIGDDAVIGAHSMVLADVPARGVAAGIPARLIR